MIEKKTHKYKESSFDFFVGRINIIPNDFAYAHGSATNYFNLTILNVGGFK